MEQPTQTAKTYIATYKKELAIGAAVVLGIIALIVAIVLFAYNNTPKIVYQPANACDLFSSADARELLGNKAIRSGVQAPVVSKNTAASTCGYTNGNADMENVTVAAISVRSGIDDKGVQQNKTEFISGKPSKNVEAVKDLGDSAYFNKERGQLNVLDDRKWIIVSYGVGAAPEANTVEDAVKLARIVLQ